MSLVGLSKIRGCSIAAIKKAILESLDLIDYSWNNRVSSVVIKANMCYYWDYSTGQTTDPRFVAALIDVLREKTPVKDIALVESDASAMKCKYAFRFLGYEKLAHDYDVRLVNLSEEKSDPFTVTCDGQSFRFLVPQIIQNADLRINVPKIKYTMKGIDLTCALKNIYGCNPYPMKFKYHSRLGKVIVALNKAMKFDLCVIDGNIVSGVQPRRLGLVMTSKDPVSIDAAAAKIAGLNPKMIKYLRLAQLEGLGSLEFISRGESLSKFNAMYPRKNIKRKLMSQAYSWVTRLKLGNRLGLG
ncbi:MAG: DUF362 domain-containing protein [Candidatus Bathyarchaeota archaeon]|nr:DUF362 domain-containing protein [Candidatus Bathyarchaeota archaeon]